MGGRVSAALIRLPRKDEGRAVERGTRYLARVMGSVLRGA